MPSMFEALQPYPEDRLHLRLHRARSVILTSQELVEIRAAQRTFEGAYMRTALSQFSFALVVLKIFTSEFYPIGALLACYGAAVLLVAVYRRYEGNRQFFDCEESESSASSSSDGERDDPGVGASSGRSDAISAGAEGGVHERGRGMGRGGRRHVVVKRKFRTSGNSVGLLVMLSLASYVALVVLLYRLS
ncbi:hypothetical protein C8A05DRAFT_40265 [Staphylotrichum tortipilum]|uniref:DUF202 domain-containing protein n=1 Tax=Staphylotrichum tortipilum TaxID=2831512 RepID=A0AAN6RXZ9_9PEZI|nr:hypothetical protein C8A05DRAFT_40265 [Staphylotrichum longicolle]